MSQLIRNTLLVSGSVILVLAFQNCSQGFKNAEDGAMDASSMSHSGPHVILANNSISANQDLSFNVYQESVPTGATYAWNYTLNGSNSGCVPRSVSNSTKYVLHCTQNGKLVVTVKLKSGDVEIPALAYQGTLQNGSPGGTTQFTIRAGTGKGAWNSSSTQVETYVGQTLVIKNGDSMAHQLHTNGKPCGHGSSFAPGGTFNCVVGQAYNPTSDGAVYEHTSNAAAQFFVVAHDGTQLYANYCASCHGALDVSTKKGATASAIGASLFAVDNKKTVPGLLYLSPKQIEAIAYVLSK